MKRYFFSAVIPITLFFVGIILALTEIYKAEGNFFNLQTIIPRTQLQYPKDELITGRIVRGSFIGAYNNLGSVSVRFDNNYRINEDSLLFRIKSQSEDTWFYENLYKTDQFQSNQLFPFGFPRVANSQGQAFVFEIIPQDSQSGNAVSVDPSHPIALASYSLDKEYYLSGFGLSSNGQRYLKLTVLKDGCTFLIHKIYTLLVIGQYTGTFILYLIPIPIYLFWYWLFGKQRTRIFRYLKIYWIIPLLLTISILARLLVVKSISDFYTISIIVAWVSGLVVYRSAEATTARVFLVKHKSFALIVPILIILKTLCFTKNSDSYTLIIVLLWSTALVIYKFPNKYNIALTLTSLSISVVLYSIGLHSAAEQFAAWTIVFFGITVFHQLVLLYESP